MLLVFLEKKLVSHNTLDRADQVVLEGEALTFRESFNLGDDFGKASLLLALVEDFRGPVVVIYVFGVHLQERGLFTDNVGDSKNSSLNTLLRKTKPPSSGSFNEKLPRSNVVYEPFCGVPVAAGLHQLWKEMSVVELVQRAKIGKELVDLVFVGGFLVDYPLPEDLNQLII